MQISLIRHGKSRLSENKKITSLEFKRWVEKYDFNGVFEEPSYPSSTLETVTSAKVIVTSDLKRAVESAKILNPASKIISDPIFREAELPSRPSPVTVFGFDFCISSQNVDFALVPIVFFL